MGEWPGFRILARWVWGSRQGDEGAGEGNGEREEQEGIVRNDWGLDKVKGFRFVRHISHGRYMDWKLRGSDAFVGQGYSVEDRESGQLEWTNQDAPGAISDCLIRIKGSH